MPAPVISPAEKTYITEGIDNDCRADGRARMDYRTLVLEAGLLSQASGSARGRLGDTDVLVGVKVEIGEVEPDAPNVGRVICNVECAPSASQQFEGRGADDLNNSLTQALDRWYNGAQSGLDLKKLGIIPGQSCWIIYIDAMVMDCDGNLFDTIVMTTRAALQDTRIPKTEIQDMGDGEFEFDVMDDVEEAEPLEGWQQSPVSVTLYKVGERYIVDPTILEELCAQVILSVGVNKDGQLCGMQKSGLGSLDPSLVSEMVQSATQLALPLIKKLDTKLHEDQENELDKRRKGMPVEKLGFFAAVI
ncbi:ribosomal protein S5 domain 2-type protein [Gongronella butleri]|nr:ribosomal protein S5 domain 2-type protein [Gongronella butleri]